MKPRNELERRVDKLASSLPDISSAQAKWVLENVIPHYVIHWTASGTSVCMDCGHRWKGRSATCPHCGAKLTFKNDSRKRKFLTRMYYGIVMKCREFTVIRIFFVQDTKWKGRNRETSFTEVLQHWVSESGTDTIRALRVAIYPYYRFCPFSLYSDLTIKRDYEKFGYRNAYYHIYPDAVYPRMSYSPLLKRNGFRKQFNDFYPEDVLTNLLADNNFETLWKLGRFDLAERYLGKDAVRILEYWKPLLRTPAMSSDDLTILLDYMDLLKEFGKDPARYNYPDMETVTREHDRLAKKHQEILGRQLLEEKKQKEKEKLAVLASKSRYFGITFGNERMQVIVLSTLEEYQQEGKLQHHCVYSNSYYGKKDSLVLSARMNDAPGKPVETIEISLDDGKILQCFGPCNSHTEYHQEILNLVNDNTKLFMRAKAR